MRGGSVGGTLGAGGYGLITMSGGTVGDNLGVEVNGTIYLDGTGFEADGTPLTYGAKLSDFGTLYYNPTYENFYYAGTITGTLADGSALDNTFEIYNTGLWEGTADIYIIPEPCSLVLFGLGGLVLRRHKS